MDDPYKPFAGIYDLAIEPFLTAIRREVCLIARTHRFEHILDVCCGTGRQCRMLHRLGFKVTGVDASPSMLAVAKRKSPREIAFIEEDATHLSFRDKEFDCAIVSFALHEKTHLAAREIIAEAKRVLKPGGKMMIVDFAAPSDDLSRFGHFFVSFVERQAGGEHYANFKDYMARGALQQLMVNQRLQPIAWKSFHLGATCLAVVKRPNPQTFIPNP